MHSNTQTVTLQARPSEVYTFLADPENLPRWAVGFCRGIRRIDNDRWMVTTGSGEVPVRYLSHQATGTIDFYMEVEPGTEAAAFSRVLPNGTGTEYVFTQYQSPGMSDDVFQHQVTALSEELSVLQGIFRARAACVA